MLDAGRLALVVRAGAGVNTIDVAAASRRGIYVSNCPGKNSIAVAELAFGLILALDRRIPDNVADLRAGQVEQEGVLEGARLYGRTLGLLGFGSIGQEMARRARAFGMQVVVWSPRFVRDGAAARAALSRRSRRHRAAVAGRGGRAQRRPQPAPRADARHEAASSAPRSSTGSSRASYVVNTARGEIVDHAALAEAVQTRGLRVALDVFAHEPAGGDRAFHRSDRRPARRLRHAPHRRLDRTGAGGDRRRSGARHPRLQGDRQGAERREPRDDDAGDAQAGGAPPRSPGRAGARVRALRGGNLNVQETENVIFEGAEAAVARINLDGNPPAALLTAIERGNPDILSLQIIDIGSDVRLRRRTGRPSFESYSSRAEVHGVSQCQRPPPHLQFLRRSCRPAAARARGGAARPGGAAGRRHVGDGDQPSLEDVRGHPQHARSTDMRALAGIPSNYKVLMLQGGASLQFSMVPMNLLGAGADRRLHRHRLVGRQGDQGSEEGRHGQRHRLDQGRQLHAHPGAERAEAHARRGLRPHHDQQHDRRHAVEDAAATSATRRSWPTPRPTCSAARSTSAASA